MKKDKSKRNGIIIISLLVLGFIIFLTVNIFDAFEEMDKDSMEILPSVYSLEDSSMISKKYRKELTVDEVWRSKVRQPIAFMFFDSTYHLISYKIDLINDSSLREIIGLKKISVDRSTGITYHIIDKGLFKFQFKAGKTEPVSKIMLTLAGDSLQTVVYNDSIINYHLLCDNLSIRYLDKGPKDIFVIGKQEAFSTSIIPMDILFLKRNKAVYLLLMIPVDAKVQMPSNLLYNVVMGV